MTVRTRAFRDGDGEAVADLHRRAIMGLDERFYTLEQRRSWGGALTAEGYGRAIEGGETIEVALDSTDRPVALCSWTERAIPGLYVAPEAQGRGIGSALLARAEAALSSGGVAVSRIESSLAAERFYTAHGYCVVGAGDHMTRGGVAIPVVIVEKALR